jgi:hypothetical protein
MKALIFLLTLITGFSASAQITTTEHPKTPIGTFAIGKNETKVTSQVKFVYPPGRLPEPVV